MTALAPLALLLAAVLADGRPSGWEVEKAAPLPSLTAKFQQTDGWTGGDGAYSIPLVNGRTLWLFGDTWIGKIEGGKRVGARMINNSAAWQSLTDEQAPLRFFWKSKNGRPASLLDSEEPGTWYWPADGAVIDGRLYLFCHIVRFKPLGPPGFQFEGVTDALLRIDNPADEPTAWHVRRHRFDPKGGYPEFGTGCLVEGDFLYAFSRFPRGPRKPFDSPLALARIHRDRLAAWDGGGWEFWCTTPQGDRWLDHPGDYAALFRDAGSEMSVSRVKGLGGFVAVYMRFGLGGEIVLRRADRPEGPWSDALTLYRCPEPQGKLFVYAAKAHPELARRDGQLMITYCRNIGALSEHVRRPDVYFPQAVEVQLKVKRPSTKP